MSDVPPVARLAGLDAERWRRAEAVVDVAIELPPDRVPAYLDEACAGDPELRRDVEAVLAADRSAGGFLERPAAELVPELFAPAAPERPPDGAGMEGRRIGAWRIVREVGRGGMGAVYLAERADGQFEQRVALKLIPAGLDTDDIQGRFVQERQILARLRHPHIASLVDGGVTEEGRPWLAMEFVEGLPITAHCREAGAGLGDVLALFEQVCDAVEYAHRNLVVHRDLKPGNIFVANGAVKLLDFGIAKVLAPEGAADLEVTRLHPRLSPYYAAPEQIRGDRPTTATDVYALGVVLYELLTGVRPYRRPFTTLADAERAILEEEPPPPSAATLRPADSAGPTPHAPPWRDRLRGDLDAIVMMALRKEPERRYNSVEALREDLRRYREGRPVLATRPTWRYRAGKFVRRNRAALAGASVVAVALVAGLLATAWQARVASRERDKARAVRDFTVGLFRASDPEEAGGDTLTARELLDRGAERLGRELKDQPGTRAEMLDVLANVSRSLGLFPQARAHAESTLALRTRTSGEHSVEVARALVTRGKVLREEARLAEAIRDLGTALDLLRDRLGPRHPEVADAMHELARALEDRSDWAAAESLYRQTIALRERIQGPRHPDVARELLGLGQLLSTARRPGASDVLRSAVRATRAAFGPAHPRTVEALEKLADHLVRDYRMKEAAPVCRELHAAAIRIYGPDHPRVGRSTDYLGTIAQAEGDFPRAESLFFRARDIFRRAVGDAHPSTAWTDHRLGWLYLGPRPGEAEARFRAAFERLRRANGAEDLGTLWCEQMLARALNRQGRCAEAEAIARRVLERQERLLPPDHPHLGFTSLALSEACLGMGRYEEAERHIRRAREIEDRSALPVFGTLPALAALYHETGRYEEARATYARDLGYARAGLSGPHPAIANTLVGLGRTLVRMGRAREARPLLEEALSIRRVSGMRDSLGIGEAQVALGICLQALGRNAEAARLLAEGLPRAARIPLGRDALVAEGRAALARARRPAGDVPAAAAR